MLYRRNRRILYNIVGASKPPACQFMGDSQIMKTKCAALLIALLSPIFSAEAEGFDGNFLLYSCNGPKQSFTHGWCVGQIYGMAEMIRRENREGATYYWKACIPDAATNQQLFDVVRKHLNDFPQSRHQDSSLLILMAFGRAFPCPK